MAIAFSTARRARVRRRSSTGSSVPPASIDSRSAHDGEVGELLGDGLQPAADLVELTRHRRIASATSSIGWRTVTPAGARCRRSPGWRWPPRVVAPGTGDGGELASRAPSAAIVGMQAWRTRRRRRSTARRRRARRARRSGASTVRTARWARCTWRRWHGSCTITGPRAGGRRQRVGVLGEPLVDVLDPRRLKRRPRRSRAGGRSPSSGRRSRRSRRRSPRRRHRRHHTRASRRACVVSPACTWRAPQQSAPTPGSVTPTPDARQHGDGGACTSRCQASITHPVNSQTSVPVARSGGGARAGGADRAAGARGGPAVPRPAPLSRPAEDGGGRGSGMRGAASAA